MKRLRIPATLALLLFLAISPQANALRLSITFEQIARQADLAFVGTVTNVEPTYNDKGFIVTDVTLAVEQVTKGAQTLSDPDAVTLRFAGGQIGDVGMNVSGVPTLELGTRYVLLVHNDGTQYISPVVGMDQGIFRVVTEPATGRELVLTDSGRFIERIAGGDVIAGSMATLSDSGRYIAREKAESRSGLRRPKTHKLPEAEGDATTRVLGIRAASLPVTDAGKVMILRSFLAALDTLANPAESD